MSIAINFGRVGIYNEEFPSIKLRGLARWRKLFWLLHHHCDKAIATKLGEVVTYYKKLQPIKSHNPLNTCSREVTW